MTPLDQAVVCETASALDTIDELDTIPLMILGNRFCLLDDAMLLQQQ
ncbi:hypothetical protein [Pararhodospirillum photometricum]|nr:hypothetical protein [Pararhodospirillum photometricum]